MDNKKKELVGDFKNAGREWRPKGSPEPVRVTISSSSNSGRAVPYDSARMPAGSAFADSRPIVFALGDQDEQPSRLEADERCFRPLGSSGEAGAEQVLLQHGVVLRQGVDHDTACFAVNAIRRWWLTMGQARYPTAKRLLITADGGGSNGIRYACGNSNCSSLPPRFVDVIMCAAFDALRFRQASAGKLK